MAIVTMKQLLEGGVHFGHQTRDWNPKMEPYIYTARNRIHIINLEKTVDYIKDAYNFVRDEVASGGEILFVCTKKQGSDIVEEEAKRCGMHYVKYRWWGGMLTNFETISKSIERLKELDRQEKSGRIATLSKKEKSRLMKEKSRLERGLSGIKDMNRPPDVMVIVDAELEEIAIAEAKKLKIPVVALLDTNCNPDNIDYVIPGNDDAIRSIKLVSSIIADAVIEGKSMKVAVQAEASAQDSEVPESDKKEKAPAAEEAVPEKETAAADKESQPEDVKEKKGKISLKKTEKKTKKKTEKKTKKKAEKKTEKKTEKKAEKKTEAKSSVTKIEKEPENNAEDKKPAADTTEKDKKNKLKKDEKEIKDESTGTDSEIKGNDRGGDNGLQDSAEKE